MKAMLINGAWRLLGALIGLVLGGGLAVFLGDAIAEALNISNFEGGRWLLLGDNCVLDVQTLTAYRFDTYPLQDGADAALNQSKLPLGLSPDQHSLVRVGESDVRDWGTQDYRGTVARLIVFDFVDGSSYTLAVDRSLMRYPAVETLDGAWLDHGRHDVGRAMDQPARALRGEGPVTCGAYD